MPFTLDQTSVSDLVKYVDQNVRAGGCDHSHRFSAEWATQHSINWDDLLDGLEAQGAFCDCEVVLNLEDGPLACAVGIRPADHENRWLLPSTFSPDASTTTTKIIVSRTGVGRNTHTKDGEWLVPAPLDAKPRKRVRKSVHFFIGIETGLPTEVGFITAVEPITIARFAHTITNSPIPELHGFDRRVASYVFRKIAGFPDGTSVGTDIVERVGLALKHRELSIHRVIFRR